ncbi:MarR family winged helix-turn-helix transcriptional regulator [Clostridium sp. CTA-7]
MGNLKCENIARYISQIQRKANIFFLKELSHLGIGYGQFLFLMELYEEDGVRQEDLSEKLNIDKGTTARAIKKLECESFIYRNEDKNDRRAYRVFLTEKGIELKDEIYKVAIKWENNLTKNLTLEEKNIMLNLLKKCI